MRREWRRWLGGAGEWSVDQADTPPPAIEDPAPTVETKSMIFARITHFRNTLLLTHVHISRSNSETALQLARSLLFVSSRTADIHEVRVQK